MKGTRFEAVSSIQQTVMRELKAIREEALVFLVVSSLYIECWYEYMFFIFYVVFTASIPELSCHTTYVCAPISSVARYTFIGARNISNKFKKNNETNVHVQYTFSTSFSVLEITKQIGQIAYVPTLNFKKSLFLDHNR
jgi:hypothetical protein